MSASPTPSPTLLWNAGPTIRRAPPVGPLESARPPGASARQTPKSSASSGREFSSWPQRIGLGDLSELLPRATREEWLRLSQAIALDWLPIAGLVPSAVTSVRNSLAAWGSLQHFGRLQRSLALHGPLGPSAGPQEEALSRACLFGVQRGLEEALVSLAFNINEHASWLLGASPLCLRLLGRSRAAAAAARLLSRATPGLLLAYGALHLARHALALRQAGLAARFGRALAAASNSTPSMEAERAAKSCRERLAWLAAWSAFELGVAIGTQAIGVGLSPFVAGLSLTLSVLTTNTLEAIFGARYEPPLALLWPRGLAIGAPPGPLSLRALGPQAKRRPAEACLAQQAEALKQARTDIAAELPCHVAWLLRASSLALALPLSPARLASLVGPLLGRRATSSLPPLTAAHIAIWRAQKTLLLAEASKDPAGFKAGEPAAALDCAIEAALQLEMDAAPGSHPVSAERAWQLMLGTWSLSTKVLPPRRAEDAGRALLAIVYCAEAELSASQRALSWGAEVRLAAHIAN